MLDRLKADPDDPQLAVYPLNTRTPAYGYDLTRSGTARLIRGHKPAGVYWLADVAGFNFLKVIEDKVPVTHLQTVEGDDWSTWMVDDPEHWVMLHAYAKRLKGPKVCVAGLGLCLILYVLADRHDITEVTVIERNRDVIDLMWPNRPLHAPWQLHYDYGDFWDNVTMYPPGYFNSIFVDLWRGPIVHHLPTVLERREFLERYHPWPKTESLFFWFQSAVDRERIFPPITNRNLGE